MKTIEGLLLVRLVAAISVTTEFKPMFIMIFTGSGVQKRQSDIFENVEVSSALRER